MNESGVFLLIFRIDASGETNPFLCGAKISKKDVAKNFLLVGVLDPSLGKTSVPLVTIQFDEVMGKTYNSIISEVEKLNSIYYDTEGFVEQPWRFTAREKSDVYHRICTIGARIHDMFSVGAFALRDWLSSIIESNAPAKDVTIIANDFTVPWYWLKDRYHGSFLCERCSLGTLQLSQLSQSFGMAAEGGGRVQASNISDPYQTLFMKGEEDLPFSEQIASSIEDALKGGGTRLGAKIGLPFQVKRVQTYSEILEVAIKYGQERVSSLFRIVHCSGHFSEGRFWLGGSKMFLAPIANFLKRSVLVLDGCSTLGGFGVRNEMEGMTNKLINEFEALGCIVTTLPLKQDPIVGEVFWKSFYSNIRQETCTIGRALREAREAMRDHFREIGSPEDPTWLLYQLIGSPSARIMTQDES